MTIRSQPYGEIQGQTVERIEIANRSGFRMALIAYGARLTEFCCPGLAAGETARD
jgi:hypothetical protein